MKTMDLYFVEASENEPIIYLAIVPYISHLLNEDGFENPNDAIEHFKVNALAKIAHLRAEADFLMDNLKSIQPMEDLK